MSIKPVQNQFNGGEISPLMDGRFDLPAYQYAAEAMVNYIPLSEGCIKRRGGSHYVASAKQVNALVFTINPTPADAKVIINGIEQKSCYCAYGDEINYSVMAENYQTKSGKDLVYEDKTLDIALVSSITFYDFSIMALPDDSDVMINGIMRSNIYAGANSRIEWAVSKSGYMTQSGVVVLSNNIDLTITLKMRFEIKPYPVNSTVMINGEKRTFIDVDPGTIVNWSVAYEGLETKTGNAEITTTSVLSVNLSQYEQGQVLFEKTDAGTINYTLAEKIEAAVYVVAAGGGAAGWGGRSVGGGSGSGYIGRIIIPAGTYPICVGEGGTGRTIDSDGSTLTAGTGGNSYIGNLVTAYGGTGGRVGRDHFDGGLGGKIPSIGAEIVVTNLSVAGNNGSRISSSSAPGGTSVYGGYGTGGAAVSASGKAGTAGYVKIVYVGVA